MTSRPRARSRARSIGVIGGVLAIALLYVVVVVLYAAGGRIEHAEASSGGEGVPLELTLTPVDIDGAASTMSVRINPTDLGSYSSDDFSMDEAVHVLVTGTNGARTIEYGADEVVGAEAVALTLDGFIEQWPFDRYTAETLIAPMRVDADGQGVPIPYVLTADGRVPGWNVVAEAVSTVSVVTEDGTITLLGVQFTITRAASTVAFGLVLLTLMVIAPVLVLTAAITVYRGRRKIEVTMLGWIGAMLFATIPLRNFFPGSPPIGSWVDYLIVLWVIAALIAGLVIFVFAWLRNGPDGVAAAQSAGDADAQGDASDADAGSDGGAGGGE
ncbi:DUF4436 family protein [Microbacterium schleiferi]|uniref:DUF4436 family protein n=1 Tax=Microbacterium schleiferi TaxID=69362 RepID=UPI0032589963